MKWYVAGPMSGILEHNYPAFIHACHVLRSRGLIVFSPHETFPNPSGAIPWQECLRHDVKTLAQCDGIILLPGWSSSRGARLELHLATQLSMPVAFFDDKTGSLHNIS